MGSRPIRHRAKCPGCGYPHHIERGTDSNDWTINFHNAPRGTETEIHGQCPGSGATVPAPVEPAKGPDPNTEGKVTVSDTGITFIPWPKIARLSNENMVITEKLDGTNACVQFQPNPVIEFDGETFEKISKPYIFAAQSRTRLITPTSDNHGFAAWAYENQESLFADLGYGVHYGEWYGAGIQRRYGLDHKRFSLFNTARWDARRGYFQTPNLDVVPLLYTGPINIETVRARYFALREGGSVAAPGYMNPEGIVVYLTASSCYYKLTDAPSTKGPKDEHGNATRS